MRAYTPTDSEGENGARSSSTDYMRAINSDWSFNNWELVYDKLGYLKPNARTGLFSRSQVQTLLARGRHIITTELANGRFAHSLEAQLQCDAHWPCAS